MSFPTHIFKAYDIRGLYPEEITEDLAFRIGSAYAVFLKHDTGRDDLTVMVCRDMRVSSTPLQASLVRGITEQGVNVVDIDLASTPTFYFGVAKYGYDGGVQVTASHNPAQFNGFKMVRANAVAISGETGIMDIRDMAEKNDFPVVETIGNVSLREGTIQDEVAYALTKADVSNIKPFHVVVDNGNGMGALVIDELFKHLPCTLTRMYFDLDGTFPNHEANPFKEENNEDIRAKILETGADLGIMLDGDSDRVFFMDNTGKTVEPAIVRGILSQIYLREYPGGAVGYDVRPGKITEDMILGAGGKPFVTRVGHSLIKEKSREMNAIFAGESSGHFFVRAPFGFFEMPAIIILKFLQEISESGKTVREYVAPYETYAHSGEINFHVADKQNALNRLRTQYEDHLTQDFDGLSFDFGDWWCNVRMSNTEDAVRLNVEAVNQAVVTAGVKEVSKIIQKETVLFL